MAHTNRRSDDKRPQPLQYPIGTKVGMHTGKGLAEGTINAHDEGGWIYVSWKVTHGTNLPGYMRSTHVIKLEDGDAAH